MRKSKSRPNNLQKPARNNQCDSTRLLSDTAPLRSSNIEKCGWWVLYSDPIPIGSLRLLVWGSTGKRWISVGQWWGTRSAILDRKDWSSNRHFRGGQRVHWKSTQSEKRRYTLQRISHVSHCTERTEAQPCVWYGFDTIDAKRWTGSACRGDQMCRGGGSYWTQDGGVVSCVGH